MYIGRRTRGITSSLSVCFCCNWQRALIVCLFVFTRTFSGLGKGSPGQNLCRDFSSSFLHSWLAALLITL